MEIETRLLEAYVDSRAIEVDSCTSCVFVYSCTVLSIISLYFSNVFFLNPYTANVENMVIS